MYKETLRPRQSSAAVSFLAIAGLIVGIVLLASLLRFVSQSMHFAYAEYIAYVLLIVLGVWVVRKRLTEYEYTLIEKELLFEKYVGKSVRVRESINLGHVTGFTQWEAYENKMPNRVLKMTFKGKKGAHALGYTYEDQDWVIMFHPSEKMAEHIRQALSSVQADREEAAHSAPEEA